MGQENISYQRNAEREDLGPLELHIPKMIPHPPTHSPSPSLSLFPKERKERRSLTDAKQANKCVQISQKE